jgi:CRP/FNR family transcriptional regulator, cyclic AMP receptor protein
VFGELATLDPAPRSATVTALADTELLELSAAPFLELLIDHPGVTRGIFRVLCARLRAASAS